MNLGFAFAVITAMFVAAATHPAQAQDEIIPVDFDPLAPGGIVIGMTGADAVETLTAGGFKGNSSRNFHIDQGLVQHSVSFNLGVSGMGEAGDPVSEIRYRGRYSHLDPTLGQVIETLNARFGAAGDCKTASNGRKGRCRWEAPPSAPLVWWAGADLNLDRGYSIQLTLKGVPDLDERLQAGAEILVPSASPPRAQYWWQEELAEAEAEAETVKFIGSGTFDQLSGMAQARVRAEAERVYEYCSKKDLFSALHDCRCVAGKFIDERVARTGGAIDPDAPSRVLTSIADDVANQCPNRPGAADYAFKKCVGQYGARLGTEVEAFCGCYAEMYAEGYMQEERANMSALTRIGSSALQECTDRGHASPLK